MRGVHGNTKKLRLYNRLSVEFEISRNLRRPKFEIFVISSQINEYEWGRLDEISCRRFVLTENEAYRTAGESMSMCTVGTSQRWGVRSEERFALYSQSAFPEMRGSSVNYMRRKARLWLLIAQSAGFVSAGGTRARQRSK